MNPRQSAIHFVREPAIKAIEPLGNGNINQTYRLTLHDNTKYVLQQLLCTVFHDPGHVMDNLEQLLTMLDASREKPYHLPSLIPAFSGNTWVQDEDGNGWRLLAYIDYNISLPVVSTADQARQTGRALGWFHKTTAKSASKKLRAPLPDLHNTKKHLQLYDKALHNYRQHLSNTEKDCRDCIADFRERAGLLQQEAAKGLLRKGLIHGDPKTANFLFDQKACKVIAIIDLDTAGEGILLHDLGDALRSVANPEGEETENSKEIQFDVSLYKAWLEGYLEQTGDLLGERDREMITMAAWTITFELGIRFFTDHLAGNRYFATRYPGHNLHRAVIQFHLCRDMDTKMNKLTL